MPMPHAQNIYQTSQPIHEAYPRLMVDDLVSSFRVIQTSGDGSCGPYALAAQFIRLLLLRQVQPSDALLNRIRDSLHNDAVLATLYSYGEEFHPYFERYRAILATASFATTEAWVFALARELRNDTSGQELALEGLVRLLNPIFRHWLVLALNQELTKAVIPNYALALINDLIALAKRSEPQIDFVPLQTMLHEQSSILSATPQETSLIERLLAHLLAKGTFLTTAHLFWLANQLQFQLDVYTQATIDNVNLFLITEEMTLTPNSIRPGDIYIDQHEAEWRYHYIDRDGILQNTPAYSQLELIAAGCTKNCNLAHLSSEQLNQLKAIIGTDISSAGYAESKSSARWAREDVARGEGILMEGAQHASVNAHSSQPHAVIINPANVHYSAGLKQGELDIREIVDQMIPLEVAPSTVTEDSMTPPRNEDTQQTQRTTTQPNGFVTQARSVSRTRQRSTAPMNPTAPLTIQSAEDWLRTEAKCRTKASAAHMTTSSQRGTTQEPSVLAFARAVNSFTDAMLASFEACKTEVKKIIGDNVWDSKAEAIFKAVWDKVIVAHYMRGDTTNQVVLGATFNRVLIEQLQMHLSMRSEQARSIVNQASLFKPAMSKIPVNRGQVPIKGL